ncbi:MAG: hypothetical protein JNK21_03885 [Rhodospirillaceae bacterium]|nr:hypothetical protein [Rhodospirillaceae bacterium]
MAEFQSRLMTQRERRRLGQVRKSFEAGLEQQAKGGSIAIEFFATCVDYIKAAMDRLHAQDQRIYDFLKPHVPDSDSQGTAILDNLDMRLSKSRVALDKLVAARDTYRAKGAAGWADFKATVAMFMDVYFNTLMKGQHSTLEMQDKIFTEATWIAVAGISEDSLQIEATQFAMVKRQAPAGADPDSFKAGPPPAAPKN